MNPKGIDIPYPVNVQYREGQFHCKVVDCYDEEVFTRSSNCFLALGFLQEKLAAKKAAAEARTEEIKRLTDEALAEVLQSYDPPVEISYNGEWHRCTEDDGATSETDWIRYVSLGISREEQKVIDFKIYEILEGKGVSLEESMRALLDVVSSIREEDSE